MNPIRSLIVDDEETGWQTLRNMLESDFPEIEILHISTTVKDAERAIRQLKPDLVFLDISLPDGDGFQILKSTHGYTYEVIFITAHHEFALKAFDFAALHYLLKPVNPEELRNVLKRYKKLNLPERIDILQNGLNDKFRKIALPTNDSILFVDLDDIIWCEASHNYTVFHLRDKTQVVMAKSLLQYERMLQNHHFFRIHDKHMVNLKSVTKYQRGKGGSAILSDGSELQVSVRKKDDFLQKITGYLSGS